MQDLNRIEIVNKIESLKRSVGRAQREIDLAVLRKGEIDKKLELTELELIEHIKQDYTIPQSRGFNFEYNYLKLLLYVEDFLTAPKMEAELKRFFAVTDIEELFLTGCWGMDIQTMEFFSAAQCLKAGEEFYFKHKA